MVRIGILTSSRADFGVYLPLIKAMKVSGKFSIRIIAFGTHLSKFHGYTLSEIEETGIKEIDTIISMLTSDTENAVSTSSALTALKFADYWDKNSNAYDWVLCLGDRYEMSAAVLAAVPYGIKFAHFYGGDYSPGAIDNVYRNCLTHCSSLHFTSTSLCAERLKGMVPENQSIHVVGIMSLEETLNSHHVLSKKDFSNKWGVAFERTTLLVTVHPETVSPHLNAQHAIELEKALKVLVSDFDIIITMPNSDTNGTFFREVYKSFADDFKGKVYLIENFGLQSYFSCLAHVDLVLGNSSSGISEAASFNKYVLNIGDRQKGRTHGENITSVPFNSNAIVKTTLELLKKGDYQGENIYFKPNSLKCVIDTLYNG